MASKMSAVLATRHSARARLVLESHPESVIAVRALLGGVAEVVGMDREGFDDLRTAVSEACNNVVLHAYPGATGPLAVELALDDGTLEVEVLDRGVGIHGVAVAAGRMRVGLVLISALADGAQVTGREGGGTEVRMRFDGVCPPAGGSAELAAGPDDRRSGPELPAPSPQDAAAGEVLVQLEPATLLTGVLRRVCAAVGVRRHFSVDRLSDLELVADELAALLTTEPAPPWIEAAISAAADGLELRLGPLPPGTWERVSELGGERLKAVEALCGGITATAEEAGEAVRVRFTRMP